MPGPLQGAAANARQTAQEKGGRTMRGDMSRLNADHVRRLRFAGMWAEDPSWDDFVAEVQAYRQEIDEAATEA
jgi:hypothetical protein